MKKTKNENEKIIEDVLEERMNDVKFPKELDNHAIVENKKKSFFSKALFVESFRSNKIGLFAIAGFNALVMIIIVFILSNLNLNATNKALTNMFSGADMESTLKMGSISNYLGFNQSSEAIISFDESYEDNVDNIRNSIDLADSNQMSTFLTAALTTYDNGYNAATGTNEEKHNTAKNQTINLASTLLSATDISEREKKVASTTLGYCLDYHYEDINSSAVNYSNRDLLIKSIPNGASDYLVETIEIKEGKVDEVKNKVNTIFNDAFTNTYSKQMSSYDSATLATFELIPVIMENSKESNSYGDKLNIIIDKLKEAYNNEATRNDFLRDKLYRRRIVKNTILDIMTDYLTDFIYYSNLEDFNVEYQTSYYGFPIILEDTGLKDSYGLKIMREVEDTKEYTPEKFTKVADGMEPTSNLLHKMNKEILTGTPYSKEEIEKAKEDSKEYVDMIKEEINVYLDKFIVSDFFTEEGSSLSLNEYVKKEVLNSVSKNAEDMLKEMYKENTGKEIHSISEIKPNDISTSSGEETMLLVKGYIVSAMSSYDLLYENAIADERSEDEATLVAVVHSSLGIIDQLPASVGKSLTDTSTMNTYGYFVGILALGLACILIPLVYNVILANSLVVDKIQTGSLAFVLSTPTNRSTYIITEAIYLLFTQVVIFLVTYIGSIIARTIGIALGGKDLIESLAILDITLYCVGNFFAITAMSSICFLTSCLFNKSKLSLASGGGINIFFFISTILGLFGAPIMPAYMRVPAMNLFNYVSIVSLYDPAAVMNADYLTYSLKLIGLIVITGACLTVGIKYFLKKDLPL